MVKRLDSQLDLFNKAPMHGYDYSMVSPRNVTAEVDGNFDVSLGTTMILLVTDA